MNAEYEIREITANTLKKSNALQLAWRVFEEFDAHQHETYGVLEFRKYIESSSIKQLLENSEMKMLGCFNDEKIIGIIALKQVNHISLLFVDKNYQRQGIARTLFQKVAGYCIKENGGLRISVNSSLYAVEIYKKLGFVATDVKQQKNGIRFIPMEYLL